MAPINEPTITGKDGKVWNEAYDRVLNFLQTFALSDHAYVSQLAVNLVHEARELHRQDPSRDPTTVVMSHLQNRLTESLAANLDGENRSRSHMLAIGTIALLLSRVYQTAPNSFLASPPPEELRQALRETLLVTGPDLNVSSMTPRHLDYGPMLQFARQTWHRLDVKELAIALVFWVGVYTVFYWCLSQLL